MTCSSQYLAGPSSGLDRYVWIYGMVCAFFHPKYEAALKWVDERNAVVRVPIQAVVLAVTLAVTYWWHQTYYILPKLEYNVVHPYTSWIPITCFIVLRNLTQGMRSWCGRAGPHCFLLPIPVPQSSCYLR